MNEDPWICKNAGKVVKILKNTIPENDRTIQGCADEMYISINFEYFRSKFEEILRNELYFPEQEVINMDSLQYLLNQLINCMKNPEEK